MPRLHINGRFQDLAVDAGTPLLWALREAAGLTGTKYGCGIGECGACTVLRNGEAVRSCRVTVGDLGPGDRILTIEGLSATGAHPVQRAWLALDVAQCGYCQSGQILAAVALLRRVARPTDAEIDAAMTNICRCGTYPRIRAAIHKVAAEAAAVPPARGRRRI